MSNSDSEDDGPPFPRLEEDNFFTWRTHMRNRLELMGIWGVVSGQKAAPTDPTELRKWKHDAQRGVSAIRTSLGPLVPPCVPEDCDDPAKLWADIEKYHEPKRWPTRIRVYNELLNAHLEPGETLISFLDRIQGCFYKLRALKGKPVMTVEDLEDELFCVALIRGLGATNFRLQTDIELKGPKLDIGNIRGMFESLDSLRQRDEQLN